MENQNITNENNIEVQPAEVSANEQVTQQLQPEYVPPQKSKKKFLWISLCAIVLAVIAVFVFVKKDDKKQSSDKGAYIFSQGLTPAKKNGKWGYINKEGEFVIEPQFDRANDFSTNGLAAVCNDDKWGYINKKGETVIDLQYDWAFDYEDGVAWVYTNDIYGLINEKGKFIIEPQYDCIEFAGNFKLEVRSGIRHLWTYNGFRVFSDNGLVAVQDGKYWGYMNKKGDWIIEPKFDYAQGFSGDGIATVEKDGKWGHIDEKGDWVTEPIFEAVGPFADNGLALVYDAGLCGYINKKGEYVIEPQFESASCFGKNNLAKVHNGEFYGYIDDKGDYVIKPQFDEAENFGDNGLAKVKKGEKWRVINTQGDYVLELGDTDTEIISIKNDGIVFRENKKYGIMDFEGNIILGARFDALFSTGDICNYENCEEHVYGSGEYCSEHK